MKVYLKNGITIPVSEPEGKKLIDLLYKANREQIKQGFSMIESIETSSIYKISEIAAIV